eukprot:6460598-Amphidinium_carterae.1
MRLTGRDVRKRLACFGERVLAQIMSEKRGKLAPHWTEGVFVGVQEALQGKSENFIVLTETGAMLSRIVKRLVHGECWDAKLLNKVRGLPWSLHEGRFRPIEITAAALPLTTLGADEAVHIPLQTSTATTTAAAAATTNPFLPSNPAPVPEPRIERHVHFEHELQTRLVEEQRAQEFTIPVPTAVATEPPDMEVEVIPVPPVRATRPAEDEGILPDTKRGRLAAILAAFGDEELAQQVGEFYESEVKDPSIEHFVPDPSSTIGGVEELRDFLQESEPADFFTTRKEEIEKLQQFGLFEPVLKTELPAHATVFEPRWVDSERKGQKKSRLTVKDLKARAKRKENKQKASGSYSSEEFEFTQSPTPSGLANRLLAWIASYYGHVMISLDVCSAYIHAKEAGENIFMQAPTKWEIMTGTASGLYAWKLVGNLYGRRTAPSAFRQLFEAIMVKNGFARGIIEPCAYYHKGWQVVATHHIDDVRIVGPEDGVQKTVAHIRSFLLIKVSPPLIEQSAHDYLGSDWVRTRSGWIIVPSQKHMDKVLDIMEYNTSGRPLPSGVVTPGVERQWTKEDEQELDAEAATKYRSAVGSLLYLSQVIEESAFSMKECARSLSGPRKGDWLNLSRVVKWLCHKTGWGVHLHTDFKSEVELTIEVDAGHGGQRVDCRSTTGVRILLNSFVLDHASFTQPGLPSMSSGESELRALSRAACDALWAKEVCKEMGVTIESMRIVTDASAAWNNAGKLGPGRIRHLRVADAFVKECLMTKQFVLIKVPGINNAADIHTKFVDRATLARHQRATGYHE